MKIVAIGGGENGRPGHPYEIEKMDKEIVKLTGKSNPNFLFIGLAQKQWADSYFSVMNNNFGKLGCQCVQLKEIELENTEIVKKKINEADIIYVGGGNTLRLMNLLRRFEIDKLLKKAGEKGAVLCGVSAGAICWCTYGNSDSRKFTSNSAQLIKVTGLGFINALFCPHYDKENARQEDLTRMMKTTSGVALAFEECTALKIVNENYEIIKSKDSAKAYKCYYHNGSYIKKEVARNGKLEDLLKKEKTSTLGMY